MQEINVKIVTQKITSSSIFISQTLSKIFELKIDCSAKMKTPKDENDKTLLLNVELHICTKDEALKIEFASDIIFEFDLLPDDYTKIAELRLIPMAKDALLNSLDEMLVIMGYNKMELAKKI